VSREQNRLVLLRLRLRERDESDSQVRGRGRGRVTVRVRVRVRVIGLWLPPARAVALGVEGAAAARLGEPVQQRRGELQAPPAHLTQGRARARVRARARP